MAEPLGAFSRSTSADLGQATDSVSDPLLVCQSVTWCVEYSAAPGERALGGRRGHLPRGERQLHAEASGSRRLDAVLGAPFLLRTACDYLPILAEIYKTMRIAESTLTIANLLERLTPLEAEVARLQAGTAAVLHWSLSSIVRGKARLAAWAGWLLMSSLRRDVCCVALNGRADASSGAPSMGTKATTSLAQPTMPGLSTHTCTAQCDPQHTAVMFWCTALHC